MRFKSFTGVLKAGLSFQVRMICFIASLLLAAFSGSLRAETPQPILNTSAPESELPPYEFGYTNPLYGTIAGFLGVKDKGLRTLKSYKLTVESFRKKFPVKANIQDQPAPLVVILLGLGGRAEGSIAKLWAGWFADAGYHVLTFDSTFTTSYIDFAGNGVSGNPIAEAEGIKNIIAAFLEQTEVHGRVTKIGIAGMSYGGLQTMILGKMANENQLPFKIDALQAYSVPINITKTMGVLDRWYSEDRWKYTLADLKYAFSGHEPVAPDHEVPFNDSLMRAAIAADFRLGLADLIIKNNDVYKLNVLPNGNSQDDEYVKRDFAESVSFTRFFSEISYPYWQRRLSLQNFAEYFGAVELNALMEKQPRCSQVILAEDDPFNTPEDMAAFKARWSGKQALILQHGGHLGFVGDRWTKAKLLTLFKTATQPNSTVEVSK